MRWSFNGPLCANEKGLYQFQPGLPLLGKSTVTQLVTWCVHWPVAKTSESATKNKGSEGQLHPLTSLSKTYIHERTSRPLLCLQQVGCAERRRQSWQRREELRLNWNQVRLARRKEKYKCQSKAEAGGIFSVNRGFIFKRSRFKKKKFSWESRLQTETISKHYKVLVQL